MTRYRCQTIPTKPLPAEWKILSNWQTKMLSYWLSTILIQPMAEEPRRRPRNIQQKLKLYRPNDVIRANGRKSTTRWPMRKLRFKWMNVWSVRPFCLIFWNWMSTLPHIHRSCAKLNRVDAISFGIRIWSDISWVHTANRSHSFVISAIWDFHFRSIYKLTRHFIIRVKYKQKQTNDEFLWLRKSIDVQRWPISDRMRLGKNSEIRVV